MIQSFSDITHCLYINLLERTDRRAQVEAELRAIGISNPVRMDAIKCQNGAIGCALSHIRCLQLAKKEEWTHVFICEDDIQFTNPPLFLSQINKLFGNKSIRLDVVLVAGNNIPPHTKISDYCIKVNSCQTTTGYIVKSHYYDKLIHNFKEGVELLMKNPEQRTKYAIDRYWFNLQVIGNWFLITPLTVTQSEGYSDIEKRRVDYSRMMLDIDKHQFWQSRG